VSAVLDHLVVAAATLAEGVQWCEALLGVTPGPGGQHPLMGTHNRLFDISSEAFPQAFFEIIAIDPAAPPPGRARWFGLDTLDLRGGPRLLQQSRGLLDMIRLADQQLNISQLLLRLGQASLHGLHLLGIGVPSAVLRSGGAGEDDADP